MKPLGSTKPSGFYCTFLEMRVIMTAIASIDWWLPIHEVEPTAINQIKNTASVPGVIRVVALPDVHFGKGATVGTVIATKGIVIPAAVGVDLGCGVSAVGTRWDKKQLPDDLHALRVQIEDKIPVGFKSHESPIYTRISSALTGYCYLAAERILSLFPTNPKALQSLKDRASLQIGTLGGGNHFIEICLDESNLVWVVLHSGSRNIGKEIAEYHIDIAKQKCRDVFLPDKDLAYLSEGSEERALYLDHAKWAQEYARINRYVMMCLVLEVLQEVCGSTPEIQTSIDCHHNYVTPEFIAGEFLLVTRKGAISAKINEWGVILGSMGTHSYVVKGRGNPGSLYSASHGAGRRMSRGEAKRSFVEADIKAQTAGIECRKDRGILDELPAAYKDINKVMSQQDDLVEPVYELRQVLCIKG